MNITLKLLPGTGIDSSQLDKLRFRHHLIVKEIPVFFCKLLIYQINIALIVFSPFLALTA